MDLKYFIIKLFQTKIIFLIIVWFVCLIRYFIIILFLCILGVSCFIPSIFRFNFWIGAISLTFYSIFTTMLITASLSCSFTFLHSVDAITIGRQFSPNFVRFNSKLFQHFNCYQKIDIFSVNLINFCSSYIFSRLCPLFSSDNCNITLSIFLLIIFTQRKIVRDFCLSS